MSQENNHLPYLDLDEVNSYHTAPTRAESIDWDVIAEMFPTLFSVFCWMLWGMFLLVPSLFGLHDAALFSAANNTVFVLMGFVLCMTISTAIRAGHGARAVFFALGLFLLSVWF